MILYGGRLAINRRIDKRRILIPASSHAYHTKMQSARKLITHSRFQSDTHK